MIGLAGWMHPQLFSWQFSPLGQTASIRPIHRSSSLGSRVPVAVLRTAILVSPSKPRSGLCRKCLHSGKLVPVVPPSMCAASPAFRVSEVQPTHWPYFVHLAHSSRHTVFLVEQQAHFRVGNVLPLQVEVTLYFLETTAQHRQPGFSQGIESPPLYPVGLTATGSVEVGGFGYRPNLALTSFLAMLSASVRLRQGMGTPPTSSLVGFRTPLTAPTLSWPAQLTLCTPSSHLACTTGLHN
jgi:hypothetical protein